MDKQTKVNILVTDLDGVLTDGRLNMDSTGRKLFKSFHTRDVRAIRELIASGWEVYICSADQDATGKHFADKVGAIFIHERDKSKIVDHIGSTPFAAIGDDSWDVPLLELAMQGFCPADADLSVVRLKGVTKLNCRGGQGVIAEFLLFQQAHTIKLPSHYFD